MSGNARYALGDKKGALARYKSSLRVKPNNPQLRSFVNQLSSELGTVSVPPPVGGRTTVAGIKLGGNLASLVGKDADPGLGFSKLPRIGFVVGAFVTFSMSNMLAIQSELLYSQKGVEYEDLAGGFAAINVHYSYVDIPVLIKFDLAREGSLKPNIFVGPSLGILMSAEASVINFDGNETKFDLSDTTEGTDIGLVVGLGIGSAPWFFDVRYSMGLMSIDSSAVDPIPEVKNVVISTMIGYAF